MTRPRLGGRAEPAGGAGGAGLRLARTPPRCPPPQRSSESAGPATRRAASGRTARSSRPREPEACPPAGGVNRPPLPPAHAMVVLGRGQRGGLRRRARRSREAVVDRRAGRDLESSAALPQHGPSEGGRGEGHAAASSPLPASAAMTCCFVAAVASRPAPACAERRERGPRRAPPQAASARRATTATHRDGRPGSSRGPGERASAHEVEVEVVDRLAAPVADVRDDAVAAIGDALGSGDLGGGANSRPSRSAWSRSARPRSECARAAGGGCASGRAGRCRGSRSRVVLADRVDGISPATMRQKRQSGSRGRGRSGRSAAGRSGSLTRAPASCSSGSR